MNTLAIFEDLSHYMDPQAARKIAETLGQVYDEITKTVTKTEFTELKDIVGELAQAQKKTEVRLDELAQAQRKIEVTVSELVQAQKKTEVRLDELAQAQKDLARAQEKTERSLNKLIGEHRKTRERLESMSDAVGYNLENQSYKGLPLLLKRDMDLEVQGQLIRRYLPREKKGQYIQMNIYGWGRKNGQKTLILGEAKTSISRQEIRRFQKKAGKAAQLENVPSENVCQVLVVHDVTPGVEEYVEEQGINLYWSYDL